MLERLRNSIRLIILPFVLLCFTTEGKAFSLSLDSIAQWGKFARFCVNTYYWGDRFFNTYDTTYVVGTGTKFNVKLTSDSWIDSYHFDFEPEGHMSMVSDVASNIGVHLTYLAVSVGYDMNVNKFFNGYERSRKRMEFTFNCALFAADIYVHNNDLTTTITSLSSDGKRLRPHIKFDGIHTDRWGADVYYFLNNKRYSQAAAFNFSRIQKKSQGTWYFGLSYSNQRYKFDFEELPLDVKELLPSSWDDYTYRVHTNTYSLKAGYAFNWVLGKHWLIAVSESPTIGYRTGNVNNYTKKSMAVNNILRASAVYNLKRMFIGLVCTLNTGLVKDPKTTMIGNEFSAKFSIGYRFNLW